MSIRTIDTIKNAKNPDGSPRYKKNTIGDFIRFLKRFHLWLVENHYSTIDEKKLSKIHTPGYDTMTKTAEQILSEDQNQGNDSSMSDIPGPCPNCLSV